MPAALLAGIHRQTLRRPREVGKLALGIRCLGQGDANSLLWRTLWTAWGIWRVLLWIVARYGVGFWVPPAHSVMPGCRFRSHRRWTRSRLPTQCQASGSRP